MCSCSEMLLTGASPTVPDIPVPDSTETELAALHSYNGTDLELTIDENGTHWRVWSPTAEAVTLFLYPTDRNSSPTDAISMTPAEAGTWTASSPGQLYGQFYTFRIKYKGKWLAETPGIWAKAVGINGKRAAIIDFALTDPEGWTNDKRPILTNITDAIIYELHYRDLSMHPSSGIANKGKFIALTEGGTRTPAGSSTGIDHLRQLGITHIQILPSYDFNSIDESQLQCAHYNWGYDPLNYNVPEGSYSTNPADPVVRIREMKEMIKTLHDSGIGVIMDVVYNHTALNDDSNFSLTAPVYFYRYRSDGSYSNASGCGNETASDRQQMRNFIVNSVKYWAEEYHIDGFRFDLMAIHDIETMNQITQALKSIHPQIFVYGEGWTAGNSPLPTSQRALKENVSKMPDIAVFSDDIRDAIKGHYSDAHDRGFATGKPGLEDTVKIGIVGSTAHPQVDYSKGNKSRFPYASSPTQIINYVSCHDNLTLTDKLAISMEGSTESDRQMAAKLAQTIVFTSQGVPLMFAGEEIFRDKQGVHNSYKSPDSINAINWNLKDKNIDLFTYYCELIKLRKSHPAFRMTTAHDVAKHIVFDDNKQANLISYSIKDNANGDEWKEIKLVFNGADKPQKVRIPRGDWTIVAKAGRIKAEGMGYTRGGVTIITPRSAYIVARTR